MLQGENTQFMVYDKSEKRYLETIYQNSLSWDAHVDSAMKFPSVEIARAIREYLEVRNRLNQLTVLQRVTTTQEVE